MSTLTATQLQQQYIAYFGRPGDPAGIKYWLSSSSGISSAREFADKIYAQDEYKTSTVGSKSTEEQVNSLYSNLFGRQADAAGLIYWTNEIEKGNLKLSNVAYDLIWAATNPIAANTGQAATDATALANKVAAAEAYTTQVETSTSSILAYQPESSTPWVTGSAFTSASTYIAGITAATAHTSAGLTSTVSSMTTAAPEGVTGSSLKLTTSTDNITGTDGSDTINGVLDKGGSTGTTIQPGDAVTGGKGTDTFTISIAGVNGANNAAHSLSAVQTDGVEKVFVSNFETGTGDNTIETGLMTGLTTLGSTSSSDTGDTIFNNMKNVVDAEMRNGGGSLTLTYNGSTTVNTGTADIQNLTVSAVTANAVFTANDMETINLKTELTKSTLKGLVSDDLTKLVITGDQQLTITDAIGYKGTPLDGTAIDATIDATGLTAKLSINVDGEDATLDVKTTAYDDTVDFQNDLDKNDIVDLGAGIDTLKLDAATLDTEFNNVTGVEKVGFNKGVANQTMDISKLPASVTEVSMDLADSIDNGIAFVTGTFDKHTTQTVVLGHSVADTGNDSNANDGVKFVINNAVDTSADVLNLTLDALGVVGVGATGKGADAVTAANYETININNKASTDGTTTTASDIKALAIGSAQTVTITGDADLTITSADTGKLTSLDASALVGKFVATLDESDKVAVKLATKSSTINLGSTFNNDDSVVGGAGTQDVLTASASALTATTGKFTVSDVETITLSTGGSNTLDLSGVTGATTLGLTDNTQTITGFDLATTIKSTGTTTAKITPTDATGTADTLNVYKLLDTNSDSTMTIESSGIESLDIKLADTDSIGANTATFTLSKFDGTTITATEHADDTKNAVVDLGTVHKNVTSIDTSGMKGAQSVSAANATGSVTFSAAGGGVATLTGGGKADTFTVGKTAGVVHVIDGGAGTDVGTVTVTASFADPSGIDIEDLTLNVDPGTSQTLATDKAFHATATALSLTGGNTLSTFNNIANSGALLAATVKTFDASAFGGKVMLGIAAVSLDDTVTITAGSATNDEITAEYTATATYKPNTTGLEILRINASANNPTLDLSNTSGVTTIESTVGASDTFTISKGIAGQTVEVKAMASGSTTAYSLADAEGSSDAVTFKIGNGTINANAKLKTDDIETVTINSDNAKEFDLSSLAMTTAGETLSLQVTGDSILTIGATGGDISVIDVSGGADGSAVVQSARTRTGASTYTGNDGADTFIMMNGEDTIDGAAGTSDTLKITKQQLLGGIAVDFSKHSTDMITTFNGAANTSIQKNFEKVDLAGITGTFGAEITGADVSTGIVGEITGTKNIDVITGQSKGITVNQSMGVDVITFAGTTEINEYKLLGGSVATNAAQTVAAGKLLVDSDTITGITAANSKITISRSLFGGTVITKASGTDNLAAADLTVIASAGVAVNVDHSGGQLLYTTDTDTLYYVVDNMLTQGTNSAASDELEELTEGTNYIKLADLPDAYNLSLDSTTGHFPEIFVVA